MRLGIFSPDFISRFKDKKLIWLHTVSVGEANAACTLVSQLKEIYPNYNLVVSTVTQTGNKIAQKLIDSDDVLIYAPLDVSFIVKKVINLIKPQVFIVAETEIWPNIITSLTRNNIPVVLVNGRISGSSFSGYKVIQPFLKGILGKIKLFCMQTEEDAKRIIQLGAKSSQVKITGNMKFDIERLEDKRKKKDLGLAEDDELFIAGSTHQGEEEIVLKTYKELIKVYPKLKLLIAPRHIERTREVERLIYRFGFKPQRISQLEKGLRTIFILDTIGQLRSLYSLADVVFVGGSLISRGGQNPIEPGLFSKPVIFGPYMSNFSDAARAFLDKKAAIMVNNAQGLQDAVSKILNEPGLKEKLGKAAEELICEHRGASIRNAELIKEVCG